MGAASVFAMAGGVVGAGGALASASAQAKAAKYNAHIARQNAVLAKQQAERDAALVREEGFRALGSIKANVGASGLTMEGSFREVLVESARNMKRDEMNVLYQGELAARGFEVEARRSMFRAKTARMAGYYNAASSLLSGGAQAASYSDMGGGGNGRPNVPSGTQRNSGVNWNSQNSGLRRVG